MLAIKKEGNTNLQDKLLRRLSSYGYIVLNNMIHNLLYSPLDGKGNTSDITSTNGVTNAKQD